MSIDAHVARLPTGTVTFMFTDIEASTDVVRLVGDTRFARMVEEHQGVIRAALVENGGVEVATEGDSVFAVFSDPLFAVEAALAIQRNLTRVGDSDTQLRVRIGLHTGNGVLGGDNYIGVDVHRASRISDSGHGGQVLVSETTARLIEDRLPRGASVRSLGRYRLAGFPEPASLHQVLADGVDEEFPPLRALKAESQLPAPLTDFVGRAREIATGIEILTEHRLLTLTGPGGTGKTRLALEIARQCEPDLTDGAYFVALASLVDSGLIPLTILEALGVKTAGAVEPLEHLTRHLSERSLLLVLDNFEQLLDGAVFVSDLLGAAPGLRVIVTSRSPLRLSGEREFPVPPLDVPQAGDDVSTVAEADGVRLFVSRAEAVRPDFVLGTENVETIAAIARSLDGLPLAIELAASRLRSLTPELVLERLGNQLLTSRSSDLPARQQTIVNAISWSYDLLDDESQRLFEQLSVFSGTFGLAEADTVCEVGEDLLDGLADLVEQSLLRQTEATGEPRFRMLTVIREYAYAALVSRGRDRDLLDRHAAAYLDLAERADAEILTSHQQYWLGRVAEEHDNLRAAFDHAATVGDGPTTLRLVGALWRFWQIRGHLIEARQRAERALQIPGDTDPVARARALIGLGGILYWQGEWQDTLAPYEEALELMRVHGDEVEVSEALYNLSFPLGYAGRIDEAEAHLRESLDICERIGRTIGVGRAHWGMGDMATFRQDWPDSVEHMKRAVDVFADLDAPFDLGWAWFMLAHSQIRMTSPRRAKEPLGRALEIFADVRDVSAMALILDAVGLVMVSESMGERAAFFAGAANRLKIDTGVAIGDVETNQYPEWNDFLANMSAAENAAYEEGYNASLDEAVDNARAALV